MNNELCIDRITCCYCGACVGVCPADALVLRETELHLDENKCTMCRVCLKFCPVNAISIGPGDKSEKQPEATVLQTDVVVVGAGPAGSVCARDLARAGVHVLVVEKKQEIGVPKRCAEAVEPDTFEAVGIEPHPLWLANRIRAAVLYAPNEKSVRFAARSSDEMGFIIERKIFEKHLAKEAIAAGARYLLKTTALGVIRENGRVGGVVLDGLGAPKNISAKIVVAADGVDSMIARSAGLRTVHRLEHAMSCFQYEMAGLRDIEDTAIHLYYGNDVAPGGYVWIFPKGNTIANVGVGIKVLKAGRKTAKYYLDRFVESHPRIFGAASTLEINAGGVPVRRTAEALVGNGLMVVGDAAQLVNPITGGGLRLAMISGRIAADVAVEALRSGDVGRKSLGAYQVRWEAEHGKNLARMLKFQTFTEKLTDDDLDRLADVLSSNILEDLAEGKYSGFIKLLLTRMPTLARLAAKYLAP